MYFIKSSIKKNFSFSCCKKPYLSIISYKKHVNACESFVPYSKIALLIELPFFSCDDLSFDNASTLTTEPFKTHIDRINSFKLPDSVSILHLNTQSIFSKMHQINEIVLETKVDIILLNETWLWNNIPLSFYKNKNYKSHFWITKMLSFVSINILFV